MSDYLEGQVKDLQDALASVEAKNKELSEKLSQANVEKFESTLAEMQEAQEEKGEGASAGLSAGRRHLIDEESVEEPGEAEARGEKPA